MKDQPGSRRVDLFDSTYGHFTDDVQGAVRRATYGTDIGQNSLLTVDEYSRVAYVAEKPER